MGAMAKGFAKMPSVIIVFAAAVLRARPALARAAMAIVAATSLLVFAGRDAMADDASQIGSWVVVELRGSAFSRSAEGDTAQWRLLQSGAAVTQGSVVRTDADGHLLLASRIDRIRLSPNSKLELPREEESDALTRVIHWLGTALFDVGKRPSRQFEVSTPYLVAVVKGTTFAVTASDAGSTIRVTEGVVGVAPAQGGTSVDVVAGETASVAAGDPGTVSTGELSDAGAAPAPALAADTTVQGDTSTGAGGTPARNPDAGGHDNGGNDDGARSTFGRGGGTHGHGCHGDGGCHHDGSQHDGSHNRGWDRGGQAAAGD